MGRMLMGVGALLFLLGLVLHLGGRFLALGRLPGDIVIQKGNFTFYFPLATSLLLSLLLTGLLWLLRR
jgi:hypothetical protein